MVSAGAAQHADRGIHCQGRGDGKVMGHDGDVRCLDGELAGDMKRCRPGTEHQHFFRKDEIRNDGSDRLALRDHGGLAVGQGWFERERPRCAAIGAIDQSMLLQLHQVSPDGFAGDAEGCGKFGGAQGWGGGELRDDVLVTPGFREAVAIRPPRRPLRWRGCVGCG